MTTTPFYADRRAALRFTLVTRGWFRTPSGLTVPFKTFDLSSGGAGIWHEDQLPLNQPMQMLLMLPTGSVNPLKLDAQAEVRYSVLSKSKWRSGLLFRNLTAAQSSLVSMALKNKVQLAAV